MMRSNRPFAGATACKSHASHTPREHQQLAFARRARGVRCACRCGDRRSIQPHHCARFQNHGQRYG
eukprot:6794191-Lingulodinium_polyedra.AAC.1